MIYMIVYDDAERLLRFAAGLAPFPPPLPHTQTNYHALPSWPQFPRPCGCKPINFHVCTGEDPGLLFQ